MPVPAAAPAGKPDDAAEPDAGDRRHNERRNEDRRKLERTSVRSLLALLVAGAAAAAAIIALWLHRDVSREFEAFQARQQALDERFTQMQRSLTEATGRVRANADQLEALTSLAPRLTQLTDSVAELRGRVDAGRRAWTLAETRYLLEVAHRGLALTRDVDTAIVALEAADARLRELRDPGLNAVRGTLAREIQSLRVTPRPDLTGIAARLAGAEELAGQLPVIGSIPDRFRPESTEESSAPGFARAWQLLRSSLTNMISIRRIGKEAVELVSLEEQNVRRQHLQLLLFSARLAAMRSDQTLFQRNIASARKWLAEMFDPRDTSVAAINETLRTLAGAQIAPELPDISASLRMLDRLAPAGQPAGRPADQVTDQARREATP
jgi:uroporphyrin-3 C-methyltransferase